MNDECSKAFDAWFDANVAYTPDKEAMLMAFRGGWNAAQSPLRDELQELRQQLERAEVALLMAARWFKLNYDDPTLAAHPPSKEDLAGMFDAMQAAREALKAKP